MLSRPLGLYAVPGARIRLSEFFSAVHSENRERAASEVEGIKKQVRDRYLAFASAIAGIRDATETAPIFS
jgi:hypothetical protein